MAADLILIASPTHHEGDRVAHAMAQNGTYAFVYAVTTDAGVQVALNLQPELVIAALPGREGLALCERLRGLPETRTTRVMLVIERQFLSDARAVGASSVLVQPASTLLVAHEARQTLERVERRALWVADRRTVFRGGRRLTDAGVG